MDVLIINGGKELSGDVVISGAKNAALPLIASTLGIPGEYILENVPDLRDTQTMIKLIKIIGCKVEFKNNTLKVNSLNCTNPIAPYELVKTMRASFYVLGPLISRFNYTEVSLPGGCAWGPRPVNYHIEGLKKLGANVDLDNGNIIAKGPLKSANIIFQKSSVGATGNIIMASINISGCTTISNASKEPEITSLCEFLNKLGANIKGIGTDEIIINGVNLDDMENKLTFQIIPDRIEAGTFLMAVAITGGEVKLQNVNYKHLDIVIDKLKQAGCEFEISDNSIIIQSSGDIKPIDITTDVYPGFPTDLQAQWTALMSIASGSSIVTDEIYLDRFSHVAELNRLGSKIHLKNNSAFVKGAQTLRGAPVMSTDIRASASLVIAALRAKGESTISRIYHLDRGYEHLEKKLSNIGASIERKNI